MLKIISDNIITCLKVIDRRGQVALFYACLIPVLVFCGGVTLDFGWYYLNVSRLQNAADAAVIAGAHKLMETNSEIFEDYKIKLIYQYPADKPYTAPTTTSTSTKSITKSTTKSSIKSTTQKAIDTTESDELAADYALKNLSSDEKWSKALAPVKTARAPEFFFSVAEAEDDVAYTKKTLYTMNDSWSNGGNPRIKMTPSLYQDGEDYFYVVVIEEDIRHFFIGFLGDMSAPVVSVALLTKDTSNDDSNEDSEEDTSPVTITFDANGGTFSGETKSTSKEFTAPNAMEDDESSEPLTSGKGTPTYSNNQKEFKGWSTTKDPKEGQIIDIYKDGVQLTKNQLTALFGDSKSVTLYAVWEEVLPTNNRTLWEQMHYLIAKNVYDPDWDVSTKKYGFSKLNHNSFDTIDKTYLNSHHYYTEYINLAAKDANNTNLSNVNQYFIDFRRNDWLGTYRSWYYSDTNSRVHALFNVNTTYKVRSGYNDDPMYLRIEAEPGNDHYGSSYYYTPVRQFVININVDNTADDLRPLFFYYDGPDAYKSENAPPQPLILNLNADFKGVLFMPDVPVVINGNGHKFLGFIVASEYRYLSASGTQVKYSSDGKTITNASDNKIRVNPSNGNVYSTLAEGIDALDLYNQNRSHFNLSSESEFRTFTAETGVKFNYIFYDSNLTMDPSPFYLNNGDLIPLYKLDAKGNQVRVTKWDDVKLYDNPATISSRQEIPKTITGNNNIRTVRLTKGEPSPLYDEAGNPVYFCDDYVNLTGTYSVFTLDRVADGTRDEKEFLLTKTDELNVPNTDDWK